jgi:hypothetical protein
MFSHECCESFLLIDFLPNENFSQINEETNEREKERKKISLQTIFANLVTIFQIKTSFEVLKF